MVKLTCAYCNSLPNEAKRAEALSSSTQSLYVSYRDGASLSILAMFIGSPQLAFFNIISKKFFFSILMFTFVPKLTNIITIMRKLRRIDLYFCKLYGLIEELSVKRRLLLETYENLINLYLSEFDDLTEDQKLWFSRFVGDDAENFYQFLRLLKTYKLWKNDDSEYLNRVYHRLEDFNSFLNCHFYESFQDYLESRFGIPKALRKAQEINKKLKYG